MQAFEVLAVGHENEPPWLIMEWIEDDLGSLSLNDQDVPTLLTHISKGLAYMHDNGFTHRDLKPGNILIQWSGGRLTAAKIADFGTTKYDFSGKMQTYTGSGIYMAPEFWERELAYTNAVDWWSFGVIAVELLTRRETRLDGWNTMFPPTRDRHQEWIREVLLPRVMLAPKRFESLLLGLLSETPENRRMAVRSQGYLQNSTEASIGMQEDTRSSKKRGASQLGEGKDGSETRCVRSNHPTLSTIGPDHALPGSTIPDTDPWGSPFPNPDDAGNLDIGFPPHSSLRDREPPHGSLALNPAEVGSSDDEDKLVKVKRSPKACHAPMSRSTSWRDGAGWGYTYRKKQRVREQFDRENSRRTVGSN